MPEKNGRKIYIGILLFVFLCAGLFFILPQKILADLEVQYLPIYGSSLGASPALPQFAVYLFNAGMAAGFFSVFLSLVIAGAGWILSPLSAEARADSRDRAFGAISGLLLLLLTYLIITTINPQLAFFRLTPLPPAPKITTTTNKTPGVYFYENQGCSESNSSGQTDETAQANTYSIADLGDLRGKVSSVEIAQDASAGTGYISILYQNLNYSGKCMFVNGNQGCQPALDPQTGNPFASSASIYNYNPNPGGDGVYFYRKSNFNSAGGSLHIPDSAISNSASKSFYQADLNQLRFNGVPADEQDCVKYDADGKCAKDGRTPPTLAGENISSIKISGDYLVLLVYYNPKTDKNNFWTYCQEFPASGDINKSGPQQIKWENIRNNKGVVPNYVMIIPI